MSVKIFLPTKLFYTKENYDIYGEIRINENNSVSYFVIAGVSSNNIGDSKFAYNELRHLGHITDASGSTYREQKRRDVSLSFSYDAETPNIYLNNINIKPADSQNANVFLYDVEKLNQLYCEPIKEHKQHGNASRRSSFDAEQYDDIHMLYYILERRYKLQHEDARSSRGIIDFLCVALALPLEAINKIFQILVENKAIVYLVKKTVFYEHYLDWKKLSKTGYV